MKNTNTKTLTRVALLVAIELVMKLVGLGSVPVGPLYMSFLTLPIAVGAITMGPAVGALLGGVFGAVSFYDAITGASAMTGALFQVSPLNVWAPETAGEALARTVQTILQEREETI